MSSWNPGDIARLRAYVSTPSGVAVTPGSAMCRVMNPLGTTVASYAMGGASPPTVVTDGELYVDGPLETLGGVWRYRWDTYVPRAVEEGRISVGSSTF